MLSFAQYIAEKKFISTTTENKLEVIANENKFIKNFIPSRGEQEQIVGVVGEAKSGLQRHLNQYQDLGFDINNVFIYEILRSEYMNLRYFNGVLSKMSGKKATIIWGNIFTPKMTKKVPNLNLAAVTHADVDITTTLNTDLTNEIEHTFITYPNLASAVFVHSLRNTDLRSPKVEDFFEQQYIQKLFKYIKKHIVSGDTYVSALKNVIEVYLLGNTSRNRMFNKLAKTFPNDSFLIQNYQGKGPMTSVAVVKNTEKQVFETNVEVLTSSEINKFNKILRELRVDGPDLFFYANLNKEQDIYFLVEEQKKILKLMLDLNKVVEKYS